MQASLLILTLLCLNIAVCEVLARRTLLRHLGTSLLVILSTAITANLGLLPTYSSDVEVYAGIFDVVAPVGIFWLLLRVSLGEVLLAGGAMLSLFLIGALGTLLGVVTGMWVVGGSDAFGAKAPALGGMFVGTYIGGSINFNAIALAHDMRSAPLIFAGANAVDALMTAVWMAVTIALPRLLKKFWPMTRKLSSKAAQVHLPSDDPDAERIGPLDLSYLLALGFGTLWLSGLLAARSGIPEILILTTIALLFAQIPVLRSLAGSRLLGMFAVYLFLAVIGAHCDLQAMREIGPLAGTLFLFVTVAICVHGLVTFGAAYLLRLDPEVAAIASQANVGGSTSALALARSLGRGDMVLPAILVGSLGTALGTYLGFTTVSILS